MSLRFRYVLPYLHVLCAAHACGSETLWSRENSIDVSAEHLNHTPRRHDEIVKNHIHSVRTSAQPEGPRSNARETVIFINHALSSSSQVIVKLEIEHTKSRTEGYYYSSSTVVLKSRYFQLYLPSLMALQVFRDVPMIRGAADDQVEVAYSHVQYQRYCPVTIFVRS